jgi:biopolymer transport protein TolQ
MNFSNKETMQKELSIVSLITNASIPVQLIMLLLLIVSVISWATIFRKGRQIAAAKKATQMFEAEFWKDRDLGQLYQAMKGRDIPGLGRIFVAGMGEYLKVRQQKTGDTQAMLDGSQRAMRAASQREMDSLESSLAFLASAGSVSPYIGLFMNSFRGLANVQQATLAAVAPGIAEALIATAIGLFAAIPAVVAYNRFNYDLDRLATRFDSFGEDFSNILQRQSK